MNGGNEPTPLISIVVNNRNYARYLAEAIESGLTQSYRNLEVIVVDDGSTDDSREVIARFGAAVTPILSAHGGQAAACNAGFAESRGEIVLFLDADDFLLPRTVERVAAAFARHPDTAKVQFRLALADAAGRRTGPVVPRAGIPLPTGDLRRALLSYPDDLAWAPMSGNAFAAWALRRAMPIPTNAYPVIGADIYLLNVTPLFGPVVSLEDVGGCYRIHGANAHHRRRLDLDQTRQTIQLSRETHHQIARIAASTGLGGPSRSTVGQRSLTLLAHRLTSVKLDRRAHPIPDDTPLRIAVSGIATALSRRDQPCRLRILRAAWFASMLIAPRSVAGTLADRAFSLESRRWSWRPWSGGRGV